MCGVCIAVMTADKVSSIDPDLAGTGWSRVLALTDPRIKRDPGSHSAELPTKNMCISAPITVTLPMPQNVIACYELK